MKAGMASLILMAAVLAAVMALRPGWLAPQAHAPAAWPLAELVSAPNPRIALLGRRRADKEEVARRLFLGWLTLPEATEQSACSTATCQAWRASAA